MNKAIPVLMIAAVSLAGCSKSPSSSASSANAGASTSTGDPVEKKLQELAGSGATNCGRLKSQAEDQMNAAGKCAMQAAQAKRPFYVAYELPGMIVAVAGNSEGKLFTVQSQQSANAQPGSAAGLASGACPAELRMAPSGRVTCFAPGTFGMGMDASHGGMAMPTMPPAMGTNPHKGLGTPPPGQANPHQPQGAKPPAKQP
ncbi:MAG: hypothetical protein HY233_01150 [Acidobacteriales bacterium]|nr:hypothetical protein [Candidatus Koribacter versatilis]MBI3644565.1 hypothetical protein [Terriglobales bacterium]